LEVIKKKKKKKNPWAPQASRRVCRGVVLAPPAPWRDEDWADGGREREREREAREKRLRAIQERERAREGGILLARRV